MKIVWLTDLHFSLGPVLGYDPAERLDAAIDYVCRYHSDAAYCAISGDLANAGERDAYVALRQKLLRLSMPVLPMVGNHDDRAVMQELIPPPVPCDGFMHYAIETNAGVILCLDTKKPGSHAGELCAERRAWVEATLTEHAGKPAYVFMHHPPFSIEMPQHEPLLLENGDAFLSLLLRFPDVQHLFAGHVHRAIAGNARGIPFTTMSSVTFQSPGPTPDWDWGVFVPVDEPPALGIVHLKPDAVIVHYDQFMPTRN